MWFAKRKPVQPTRMPRLTLIQKACFAIEAGTEQTLIEQART
jgi:hypothetical protein